MLFFLPFARPEQDQLVRGQADKNPRPHWPQCRHQVHGPTETEELPPPNRHVDDGKMNDFSRLFTDAKR